MSISVRRNHSASFKAKVALEALRGEQTVPEIAAKHGIHHTLVNQWKRAVTEGASTLFEKENPGSSGKENEVLTNELYKQIGQQKVQIDFLSRALGK
jgi:transposase